MLRLLGPRSEDAEAGPHASVRNRVHGRVTGPFPFRLRQGYGATSPRDGHPGLPKGEGMCAPGWVEIQLIEQLRANAGLPRNRPPRTRARVCDSG